MTRARRSAWALAVAALVAAGCGSSSDPQGVDAARAAATTPLTPVTLPDLSRVAISIQERIRSAYADLQIRTEAGAPAHEQADAYGALGKLLLASEFLDEAGACFDNAAVLAPEDSRWPHLAGHAFRLAHLPAEAAARFERVLSLTPGDVTALLWLADMQLALNRLDAAGAVLDRARSLAPEAAAVHDALGRAALARRDYRAATAHLERALAAAPAATRLHYRLGLAYRGIGDHAKAEAHLRRRGDADVVRDDPLLDDVGGLLRNAAAYEIRAARALEERRWSDAVADLRTAAELAPDNAVVRLNLGNALYQTGDTRGALEQLQSAARLDPAFAKAHYAVGVLMDIEGRDEDAIRSLSSAVAADPGHAEARLGLAEALRRVGRAETALPHYALVAQSNPELSQAVFGHAMAHVRLGRYREARDLMDRGMRMYPDQPGFAHALARVLAASPDDDVRDGQRALTLVSGLLQTQKTVTLAETMAMALAELGRFDEARRWQQDAISAATQANRGELLPALSRNLARYERRQPCRLPWADDDPIHRPRIAR